MGKIHDAAREGKLEEVKAQLTGGFFVYGVNIDEKDGVSKRMSS